MARTQTKTKPVQCSHILANGKRCQRSAKPEHPCDGKVCWQHCRIKPKAEPKKPRIAKRTNRGKLTKKQIENMSGGELDATAAKLPPNHSKRELQDAIMFQQGLVVSDGIHRAPFVRPSRRDGPALTAADNEDVPYLEKRGYKVIEDLKPVTRVTSWGEEHRKIVGSMNVGLFVVTGGFVPTGKQGVAKLMVKHQYQDPEEEIRFAARMGRAGLGPKVYDVVRFRVRDEKSGKMNEIYALIMERMDGSLVDLQPFQPHDVEQLVGRVVRIYLDLMLKYRIRQLDPKPANFLFDVTPQNGYRIVLGDYGIAEDIKEEHFDAKNVKKFIEYDMLNMFIGAYADEDEAHERRPAEVNYGLVYKTLKKAVGQAHVEPRESLQHNNNISSNMSEHYRQALASYLADYGVIRTAYGNYSDKFGGFIIVARGNDVAKLYKTRSLFAGQTHFFMSGSEYKKIERLKKRILQAEQLESMRANPD